MGLMLGSAVAVVAVVAVAVVAVAVVAVAVAVAVVAVAGASHVDNRARVLKKMPTVLTL